jgi:hypothetical protein
MNRDTNNNNNNDENIQNSMITSTTSLDKSVIESSSMLSLDQITSDNATITGGNDKLKNSTSLSLVLNEKVATLASSIYTELEKIVKLYGRDTVKDLMSIVVNVLEALDAAIHEKEELLAENELLRDDYEKLLNQYDREKQSRKETELKLFQSEDQSAEQKKEYEEKVKSLESIVRMIDLKSKNTSDQVMRLEEKEQEFKREYNKLHERYTELFKTHCDYMERTKILFGNESNRIESSASSNGNNPNANSNVRLNKSNNKNHHLSSNLSHTGSQNSFAVTEDSRQLLDLLKSSNTSDSHNSMIDRTELISALKACSRIDIQSVINQLSNTDNDNNSVTLTNNNKSSASLTSLVSSTADQSSLQQQQQNQVDAVKEADEEAANTDNSGNFIVLYAFSRLEFIKNKSLR